MLEGIHLNVLAHSLNWEPYIVMYVLWKEETNVPCILLAVSILKATRSNI